MSINKVYKVALNGFTLVEVMVTLALTSLSITFAYGTLNYVQKLFVSYKLQNQFMYDYTNLKQRLNYEALYTDYVTEINENEFVMMRDCVVSHLLFKSNYILIKQGLRNDTFHLAAKDIKREYESLNGNLSGKQIIKSLNFEVGFSKQEFKVALDKNYDASVKLRLLKGNE